MANLTDHAFAGDARNPFGNGGDGAGNFVFNFDLGTDNLTAGDTYKLFKIAQPCFITDCYLEWTDLDTNATDLLKFDVGTSGTTTNDDSIMATVDEGGAAGFSTAMVAERIALVVGDIIEFSIDASAATAAAGNVTLSFKLSPRQPAA